MRNLSIKKCCALIAGLATLACLTPSEKIVHAASNFVKPTIVSAAFTSPLSTTPDATFNLHVNVDHDDTPHEISEVGIFLQRPDGSYIPEPMQLNDSEFGTDNDGFWGLSFDSSVNLDPGKWSILVYARNIYGSIDTHLLTFQVDQSRYFDVESPAGSSGSTGIGSGSGGTPGSGSGSGSSTEPTIKTADGYTSVQFDSAYTPAKGFGWLDITDAHEQLGTQPSPVLHTNQLLSLDLVSDCVSFYKQGLFPSNKDYNVAPAEFRVDLDAPGTYRCVAYLGNNRRQLDGLQLFANGLDVVSNLRACATMSKGNVARKIQYLPGLTETGPSVPTQMVFNCFGGYTRISFTASTVYDEVHDTHSITLVIAGNKHDHYSHPSIAGLEFLIESPCPLTLDQSVSPAQLVANKSYTITAQDQSTLNDFLVAFNNPDSGIDAKALLESFDDPLLQANAALWIVGWLDASQEYADIDLLDQTIELLNPLADFDTAARELLHDALNFRNGVGFLESRGYTADVDQEYNWAAISPSTTIDPIIQNHSLADQFLRQIHGNGFNGEYDCTVSSDHVNTSPLYPRAQFLRARLYYSIATKVVKSDEWTDGTNADHWTSLMETLTTEQFPQAFELNVWRHMAINYYQNGGKALVDGAWKNEAPGQTSSSSAWVDENDVIDKAWWNEYLILGNEKNALAPEWANAQREYANAFRNAAEWWVDKRLKTADNGSSQIGTGDDDDEGAGQLAFTLKAINEQARHGKITSVMDLKLLDPEAAGVDLNDSYVDYDEGYIVGGKFDTEHSGEYTTNRLMLLYQATPEDEIYEPKNKSKRSMYREIMINMTQNLFNDECGLGETGETLCNDQAPWTVTFQHNGETYRHIRSRFITGNQVWEVKNEAQGADKKNLIMVDDTLNYRALVPVFFALNNPNWEEYNGKYGAIDFHGIATNAVLEMAQSWVRHVLAEESGPDGKPMGIPPAAVWVASDDPSKTIHYGWPHQYSPSEDITYCQEYAQNTYSDWWRRPGYKDFYSPKGSNGTHDLSYLYQLFLEAYRLSTKHPELGFDRIEFLKPFLYGMLHVTDPTLVGNTPNPECNSALYARKKLAWVIKNAYAEAREAILYEFENHNLPAPFTQNHLDIFDNSVTNPYAKYLISSEQSGGHSHGAGDPKGALTATFDKGSTWMNYYWPLATNSVTYTDRIYTHHSARGLLYTCQTGQISPHMLTPPISWSNNPGEPSLHEDSDMAILVRKVAPDSFEVLLYNFKQSAQPLDFQIWSTLNFGDTYDVEIGAVTNEGTSTETFTPSSWSQFTYDAIGKSSSITVAPQELQLLKITRSTTQAE